MTNKVTIVIPTFNRAKYVCNIIDAALNQTIPCDVIVCDHGSKDNTPEIVKKYGDKITYIRREKDFGPHFCWLEGVLNANTEYVHIHFDDDLMEPNFIEKTLELMSDDVGIVFSDAKMYNPDTMEITNPYCFNFKRDFETGVYNSSILEKKLMQGLMLSPAVCLYRKKDIIDAILPGDLPIDFGGTYHGVGPDLLMNFLAVLRYPKFGVVTEALTWFGAHDGSITVDACKEPQKLENLQNGYNAFRKYYALIKLYKEDKNLQERIMQILYPVNHKKLSIWQRIFSVRNSDNKKHKIITILGLKIKIKRNKGEK